MRRHTDLIRFSQYFKPKCFVLWGKAFVTYFRNHFQKKHLAINKPKTQSFESIRQLFNLENFSIGL